MGEGYYKLTTLTGDFYLVSQPTLADVLRLNPLIKQFKSEIAEENVWPTEFDRNLYSKFKLFYSKIGAAIGVDPDVLTRDCRHQFFVCDGVVDFKGQRIADISQIEKLMGYLGYTEIPAEEDSTASTVESTGDLFLDLAADSLLIFKIAGLESIYSPSQLYKMCKYASDRMRQAEEDAKNESVDDSKSDLEKEPLDPDLEVNLHRVSRWLSDREIPYLFS